MPSTIPPELDAEMTPAVRAFVQVLLARIESLENEVAELKRRLGQTPENSSRPPSSQHPHAKTKPCKKPSGKKRGGQPGHERHQRNLVPPEQVTKTIRLKPPRCRRCGEALAGDDPEPLRHQVFELPEIRPIITEYQRHRLACPCCGVNTTAPLPAGAPTGQSGPRLVAFAALLMAYFRQSKRRTALFLEVLLNVPSSSGHMVKLENLATDALRPCYDALKAALPEAGALGLDETATKQANRKAWLSRGGGPGLHVVCRARHAPGRGGEATVGGRLRGRGHLGPLRRLRLDPAASTLLGALAGATSNLWPTPAGRRKPSATNCWA